MSDRHPKWRKVEPGDTIPEGQPYRVEYPKRNAPDAETAREYKGSVGDFTVTVFVHEPIEWFVDSSWKPPLVLPTEPTWGIALISELDGSCSIETVSPIVDCWSLGLDNKHASEPTFNGRDTAHCAEVPEEVLDFIPLTDEQVARIEAAR